MAYARDNDVRALAQAFGADMGEMSGQIATAQLRKNTLDATRAPGARNDRGAR